MPPIPLCSSCFDVISPHHADSTKEAEWHSCVLCFGLMDPALYESVIADAKTAYERDGFDGDSFVMAVNVPVSQHFREQIVAKLLGSNWCEKTMSPKSRLPFVLMGRFRQHSSLRPSLNADLTLTVTFENDEFTERDIDYLLCHYSRAFMNTGKKRFDGPVDHRVLFTKVKVQTIVDMMPLEKAKGFNFVSPSLPTSFSARFERDQVYIAGRYCKYSRSLPQSPWTPNRETPKIPMNSVSEQIGTHWQKFFKADSFKFIASGREDIDVRMLGTGRPFAVCLINAKKWACMHRRGADKDAVLVECQKMVNSAHLDVEIGPLATVNLKETQMLNVGQEEKKKVYSALCYSHLPITDEAIKKLEAAMPVEISQLTPLRVLFRRPLLDRKRTIHAARILPVDDHYFHLQVETQAGTYVKEFVHSDFGRTRPSVGTLLGFPTTDGMSILELDVLGVDMAWPPTR
uniref:tRNA pseudouridine(55) synthase n=1 Tax=Panagrellus redivivus TaxID=6233 RepID=A0A7E4W130_PANRE